MTDISLQTAAFGGFYGFGSMADEMGGSLPGSNGSTFTQSFSPFGNLYDAVYNVGFYAQDEWHASPELVLSFGLRVDRTGNPLCVNNCYSYYKGGFPDTAATLDTPYNQTIIAGQSHFVPQMERAVVQPRGGFNWNAYGKGRTVIRGGVGLFSDSFQGLILEQTQLSFPNRYFAGVSSGAVAQGTGSAQAVAAGSAQAVLGGFSQGATFNSLTNTLATQGIQFTAPNYATTPHEFRSPRYLEFSLQLQQAITQSDAIIISYAGNHGYSLYMPRDNLNQNVGTSLYGSYGNGTFDTVPINSPDPRFGLVQGFTNNAKSNYNGVSVQYKHVARGGLTTSLAYTYSHSLDDISNGGNPQLPYNGNTSVSFQITPNLPSRLMYSNSDYDIRNNFVMDFLYVEPHQFSNRLLNATAAGWTIGQKAYWRSGQPFSVFNVNAENAIGSNATGGAVVLAEVLNQNFDHRCVSFSKPCFQDFGTFNGTGPTGSPTLPGGGTLVQPVQTIYGNVPRNAFYGPHYANVDVTVLKDIFKWESVAFQVGAQSYNVLNHVNFGPPATNASNLSTLGRISSDINAPTSPYGSSQEPTVAGRVLVVQGRLVF